jgi:hypothetical protein
MKPTREARVSPQALERALKDPRTSQRDREAIQGEMDRLGGVLGRIARGTGEAIQEMAGQIMRTGPRAIQATQDPQGHKANAPEGYVFAVVLPDPIFSANAFSTHKQKSRDLHRWIGILTAVLGWHSPPEHQQILTITRIYPAGFRAFDDDNMMRGSSRQIMNALKRLGYFKDDSPKWLRLECRQTRGKVAGCEISLRKV